MVHTATFFLVHVFNSFKTKQTVGPVFTQWFVFQAVLPNLQKSTHFSLPWGRIWRVRLCSGGDQPPLCLPGSIDHIHTRQLCHLTDSKCLTPTARGRLPARNFHFWANIQDVLILTSNRYKRGTFVEAWTGLQAYSREFDASKCWTHSEIARRDLDARKWPH